MSRDRLVNIPYGAKVFRKSVIKTSVRKSDTLSGFKSSDTFCDETRFKRQLFKNC